MKITKTYRLVSRGYLQRGSVIVGTILNQDQTSRPDQFKTEHATCLFLGWAQERTYKRCLDGHKWDWWREINWPTSSMVDHWLNIANHTCPKYHPGMVDHWLNLYIMKLGSQFHCSLLKSIAKLQINGTFHNFGKIKALFISCKPLSSRNFSPLCISRTFSSPPAISLFWNSLL